MRCFKCDKEASGVCIFCGRGVCKEHFKKKPNILGVYDEPGDDPSIFMVEGALWCEQCEPVPAPVKMPEIE